MDTRTCVVCQEAFETSQPEAKFCSTPCRKHYNNARLTRGAIVYDLLMVLRYDRKKAKEIGAFQIMCDHARQWREEDKEARKPVPKLRNRKARRKAAKRRVQRDTAVASVTVS